MPVMEMDSISLRCGGCCRSMAVGGDGGVIDLYVCLGCGWPAVVDRRLLPNFRQTRISEYVGNKIIDCALVTHYLLLCHPSPQTKGLMQKNSGVCSQNVCFRLGLILGIACPLHTNFDVLLEQT